MSRCGLIFSFHHSLLARFHCTVAISTESKQVHHVSSSDSLLDVTILNTYNRRLVVIGSFLNWTVFALFIAVYWLIPSRFRPASIAVASLVFLLFNDFIALGIIVIQLLVCTVGARWMLANGNGARARFWTLITLSLIPLLFFKYPNLLGITRLTESGYAFPDPSAFALPLGISYFTFKVIMYLVETARGNISYPGLSSLIAYIAFVPTLSSGPIDRPKSLIAQISNPVPLNMDRFLYGLYRIVLGVIFKFVISDTLREFENSFAVSRMAFSVKKQLIFGPYYSLLLYFDFAGYSHIAIGAGVLLGIKCMENFAAPYLRANISGFWRGWHISLTTFLRDYIFFPIAFKWSGALGPQRAAYIATVITFVVCGAWHGDGVNFLLWGFYHGIMLSVHQAFLFNTKKRPFFKRLRRVKWLAIPATAFTFLLVSYGWYPFAFNFEQLAQIFGGG